MSVQPLRLPKISSEQAKLSNFLSSLQTEYDAIIAGQPAQIKLTLGVEASTFSYQLNLNVNNTPIMIELDSAAVSLFLPGKVDHNAISMLPTDLVMGALHYTLAPTLQQAAQLFEVPVEIVELTPNSSSQIKEVSILLSANISGTQCSARLDNNQMIRSLLHTLPRQANYNTATIPIRAGIELGRSLLSVEEIDSLETGDIIFLQQHVTGEQVIIRVNTRLAFIAETDEDTITIQQRMIPMDENEEYDGLEDGVDLSVELLFEIGQQQFSVSDLENLQPGFVFELDRPVEQPVRVRANGKVIAECQLVQIDNRLGAKIISLNKG